MTRVVICDGHKVFGEAMASVLAGHGYDVVACTGDLPSGLAAVARHGPDLYLVDLHFGGGTSGLDAVRRSSPGTRIVVVSGTGDAGTVARAAGADGFVAKHRRLNDILDAIARVAAGEEVFHDPAPAVSRPRPPAGRREPSLSALTGREREVLDRLVEGKGTAALALELGISYATARTHIQRLITKLGVHSKLEAVALVNGAQDRRDR
ncbi:MAG: LuxR C-terminal-related transcriptional regulator [Acidimicrobiales bacterium]